MEKIDLARNCNNKQRKGTATALGVGLLLGVVHRPPSALPSSLVHHAQQSTAASSLSLTAHECPQTPEK